MNKRHTNKPERTRRRMTLHSSFFILRSSLLLLLLAACTNDPTEDIVDVAPGTLPEGTFVIDYTASTGDASTRATAAERIQSLDYLLYESTDNGTTFTLKHRRSIPDIGETTVWPLNRETMTWKQRQALKDTLNTACQYKMVFVANADKSIWSNTEVLQNVTEGNSTFDEGRLVLPPRVFRENDMYYMWSNHDKPLLGSEYSKDNPAQMDILLQRMINKVEVKLDDAIPTEEAELGTYLQNIIETYYKTLIASSPKGKLYTNIENNLTQLANDLSVGALSGVYGNARDVIKNFITSSDFINGIINQDLSTFTTTFKESILNQYKLLCYWNPISYVKIEYEQNSYAQAIDFTQKSIASNTTNDPLSYSLNNNTFIYYIFGNNESGNNNTLNHVSKFCFIKADQPTPLFTISGAQLPINKLTGGNNYYSFTCNPIENIDDTQETTYELPSFSIKEKYGNDNWTKDNLNIPAIGNISNFENYLNNNSGYKDANDYVYQNSTLESIYLKFNYPIVTISPQWND